MVGEAVFEHPEAVAKFGETGSGVGVEELVLAGGGDFQGGEPLGEVGVELLGDGGVLGEEVLGLGRVGGAVVEFGVGEAFAGVVDEGPFFGPDGEATGVVAAGVAAGDGEGLGGVRSL